MKKTAAVYNHLRTRQALFLILWMLVHFLVSSSYASPEVERSISNFDLAVVAGDSCKRFQRRTLTIKTRRQARINKIYRVAQNLHAISSPNVDLRIYSLAHT